MLSLSNNGETLNQNKIKLFVLVAFCVFVLITQASAETWSNKTGELKIEAEFLKFKYGNVYLLKEDDTLLTIPIGSLSLENQESVKKRSTANVTLSSNKSVLPVGVKAEESERLAKAIHGLSQFGREIKIGELSVQGNFIGKEKAIAPFPKLEADPELQSGEFKPFYWPLGEYPKAPEYSSPILIDPATSTYAISAYFEARDGNLSDSLGRVYLASADQSPKLIIDDRATLILLDHHVQSKRSLILVGANWYGDGGDLVLLENLATGKPTVVKRWHLPGYSKSSKAKIKNAKLLDGERAFIHLDQDLYVWDLMSGQLQFEVGHIHPYADVKVSANGKYLAIPMDSGVLMADLQAGELLGKIEFKNTQNPKVSFSQNGELLAIASKNEFMVWDLVNAQVKNKGVVSDMIGDIHGWIDNKYILTQFAGVVDPALGRTLWNYPFSSEIDTASSDPVRTVQGGVLVAKTDVKGGSNLQYGSLQSLPILHESAQRVADLLAGNTNNKELLEVQPGTEVSLVVKTVPGIKKDEIYEGIKGAIQRSGWIVTEDAEVKVFAVIGRKKQIEIPVKISTLPRPPTFDPLNPLAPAPNPLEENIVNTTMTPFTASLQIIKGNDILWERKTANRLPAFLAGKKGETVQQTVSRYEYPDHQFFKELSFPPKILKKDIKLSIQRSYISEGKWVDYSPND
ncbi:MAG: hypothetical protein COA78_21605 [Blastopirellula sp.]|nr:MAG: hypothetical protein COA78_21605 [Blastopirellula sp.]